ncbi:MAG TPA: 4'-phosphopantetheinyl transferase superfamily protein [Coleofasciculaceae cyanobacterium]
MLPLRPEWRLPPDALTLLPNEVQVWQAELDQSLPQVQALHKLLSVEEQSRAARFRREVDRWHFVVGRGSLRQILGQYLHLAPDQLQLGYGDHGKPFLIDAPHLQFNVSHAHGLALYVVRQTHPIGVDLEHLGRPLMDLEQLSERFFSAKEHAELLALPADQKLTAFFRGWTAKEAYLKAIGTGLSQLEQVEVTLSPGTVAQLTRVASAPFPHATDWSLYLLEPAPTYLAAIVTPGQPQYWRYWRVQPQCD